MSDDGGRGMGGEAEGRRSTCGGEEHGSEAKGHAGVGLVPNACIGIN